MKKQALERLWSRGQFPQLRSVVYADWTGAAIPPLCLLGAHDQYLRGHLLGNPHSEHGPSVRSMRKMDEARGAVLRYLDADPEEYDVIFASGATGAILLLHHFMWDGGELLLTEDNHNSVNGLREVARRHGAVVRYAPIRDDLSLDEEALRSMLEHPRSSHNRLFAFPAKSNYSGVTHSLEWVGVAQELGWSVLLDMAAFMANDRLSLRKVKPDFLPVSFYKIFGFPTGVGCLVVRRSAYAKIAKRHFAGGSIKIVSVARDFFVPEAMGHARFEDGTPNFGSIPAVTRGFAFMEKLGPVKMHAVSIAASLRRRLLEVREGKNDRVLVHSPEGTDIVTFNLVKRGHVVDAAQVEARANRRKLYLRSGCFCNPGANERSLGYTVQGLERLSRNDMSFETMDRSALRAQLGGQGIGAVRASFGYASRPSDADKIADFVRDCLRTL